MLSRTRPALWLAPALACTGLFADHGPGTSGGGLSVQSGEVLKRGAWALELRSDYTAFKIPSDGDIAAKAASAGAIDVLDHSLLHGFSLAYGVAENIQISASFGYYAPSGGGTVSYDADSGLLSRSSNEPKGLTDLWINGKWAFYKGPLGRFAFFGGVKFPTGKKDVLDSNEEAVDFASTPGSGAADFMAGLGYSTYLTPQLMLDASASHTVRGTYHLYRLGDRTEAGVALAWRFTENIRAFPQSSGFMELNFRRIGKVQNQGEKDGNSGGTAIFLSPGLRFGFSPHASLSLAAQLPLMQSPNGAQIETKMKAVASLSLSF